MNEINNEVLIFIICWLSLCSILALLIKKPKRNSLTGKEN